MEETKLHVPTTEETIAEINEKKQSDPVIKAWFEGFQSRSHEDFIRQYANARHSAASYKYPAKERGLYKVYGHLAETALKAIQFKKLINLQCQWRAGLIDLPNVLTTADFHYNLDDLLDCPFLPPVSQDEMALFSRYVESPDFDESDFDEWNTGFWFFDEARKRARGEKEEDEEIYVPEWHDFYDNHMGTGHLLLLPDIRGEWEHRYIKAYYEKEKEGKPTVPAPAPDPDAKKPRLGMLDYENFAALARLFESQVMLERMTNYVDEILLADDFEEVDQWYESLKAIPENHPFVEHPSWREALRLTVTRYRWGQAVALLPKAWKKYFRDSQDDPEGWLAERIKNHKPRPDRWGDNWAEQRRTHILKGREALGEPANFDYLDLL